MLENFVLLPPLSPPPTLWFPLPPLPDHHLWISTSSNALLGLLLAVPAAFHWEWCNCPRFWDFDHNCSSMIEGIHLRFVPIAWKYHSFLCCVHGPLIDPIWRLLWLHNDPGLLQSFFAGSAVLQNTISSLLCEHHILPALWTKSCWEWILQLWLASKPDPHRLLDHLFLPSLRVQSHCHHQNPLYFENSDPRQNRW